MSHPSNVHLPANYVGIRFDIRTYGSKTNTVMRSNCAREILKGKLLVKIYPIFHSLKAIALSAVDNFYPSSHT